MWVVGVIIYILFSGIMFFDDENKIRLYWFIFKVKYSYVGEVCMNVVKYFCVGDFYVFFGLYC